MGKIDFTKMTVAELKTLAKKKKVSLLAGATKAEIIKILSSASPAKKATAKKVSAKKAAPAKKTALKKVAPKKVATKKAASSKKPSTKKITISAKKVASAGTKAAQKTSSSEKRSPVKAVSSRRTLLKKSQKKVSPVREWKRLPKTDEPFMTQEMVSDSKYYTGPGQQPLVASSGDLPQGYGEEKITLLSRDPHVAYAYWETTPERIEREKAWFGMESKLCVRIYDITGVQFDGRNAIGYYDQEIFDRVGSWYLDLGRPNHAFCADLGLLSAEGRFLTFVRSSYITMPRDNVSDVIDEEWMLLDEEFMKLYGIPSGLSSPQIQEMVEQRRKLEITSPGTFSRPRTKRKLG
jgi:hypothetical protein